MLSMSLSEGSWSLGIWRVAVQRRVCREDEEHG
jgi:hypothetical protein